jgi:hypothetical protein
MIARAAVGCKRRLGTTPCCRHSERNETHIAEEFQQPARNVETVTGSVAIRENPAPNCSSRILQDWTDQRATEFSGISLREISETFLRPHNHLVITGQSHVIVVVPVQPARHSSDDPVKANQVDIEGSCPTCMKACWRPNVDFANAGDQSPREPVLFRHRETAKDRLADRGRLRMVPSAILENHDCLEVLVVLRGTPVARLAGGNDYQVRRSGLRTKGLWWHMVVGERPRLTTVHADTGPLRHRLIVVVCA